MTEIIDMGIMVPDKGYDAKWVHQIIRKENIMSMIPVRGNNMVLETRGHHRKQMRREFDESLYHQRNKTETIFSVIKRRSGSEIKSYDESMREKELLYRILAYNCHRMCMISALVWLMISRKPSLHNSIILCDNAIEELQILNTEIIDIDIKIKIIDKISEFEERKTSLYEKTHSVQEYLDQQKVIRSGAVVCVSNMNGKTRKKLYKLIAFRDGEFCKQCEKLPSQGQLVVDHIDDNNSNNSLDNLQLLCRACNYKKNARRPLDLCVRITIVIQKMILFRLIAQQNLNFENCL